MELLVPGCTNLSGDHRVRKAVIPVAGMGTRLFPATRATKKAFFPIIDRDGIAKPAILLIVEEALDAGIEEVIVVVQERDLDDFRSFFDTPRRSMISAVSRPTSRNTPDASRT